MLFSKQNLFTMTTGRFGNQADHFLGAFGFAHGINRTLILPPWVEYRKGESRSIQVPFDEYFQVEKLRQYHRVITMEDFMLRLAPKIWPPGKRIAFCYTARYGIGGKGAEVKGCNPKNGNPFGPFWDTFDVDFIDSEFYEPLNYDVHHREMGDKWNEKYPADRWPVLAFTGAPGSFPVQIENRNLQKYLVWSDRIQMLSKNFIKNYLPKGAFIGVHFRNGVDWVRACEHVSSSNQLFSSPQCLGYRNENGKLTMDMCYPTRDIIVRQLKRHIKSFKEKNPKNEIKSIFVASDSNHFLNDVNTALARMNIIALKLDQSNPHVDLAILALSNYFIGNCVSSFTAFVKRERDARNFPSSFWGFPAEKSSKLNKNHDEL